MARWAWVPAPAILLLLLAVRAANPRFACELPGLLIAGNLLFSTMASAAVAAIIARSFIQRPALPMLLLGFGVLTWGIGTLCSSVMAAHRPNELVTLHNLSVWLAACGHLGAVLAPSQSRDVIRKPFLWLTAAYASSLAAVALVVLLTLKAGVPVFFVQGKGGTLTRQYVLMSGIAMLLLTAARLRPPKGQPWSAFGRWYCLALQLLAVGLFGVMVQTATGSLLGWIGRAAQYLGGVYMLLAALSGARQASPPALTPERRTSGILEKYLVAVALVIAGAAVRLLLLPELGSQGAFVTFYPAIILAALHGGFGPGMLTTILSMLLADYFWMEPVGSIGVRSLSQAAYLALFFAGGLMMTLVTQAMHRSRTRAAVAEKTAEHAAQLAAAERRQRQISQDLSHAQAVAQIGSWRLDVRQNLLTWSDEVYRIFGISKGTPLSYQTFLATVHPDDRGEVDRRWNAALAGEPYDLEHRILCEGQVKWVRQKAQLEHDQAGVLISGFGITQDITQRKQAEEQLRQYAADLQAANASLQASRRAALNLMDDALAAQKQIEAANAQLRESQERLAAFAQASFEGIVLTEQGRILDCNEQLAQMLQIPVAELRGRSIEELIVPEDRARVMQNIRAGQESVTEHQMIRADGSRITVEAHGRPRPGESRGLRHTAIRDITERKQREELLRKLNQTLKALKESSQAMVRAATENQYLAEVCRILKEDCGHAMVWIGLAPEGRPDSLASAACAGLGEAQIDQLQATLHLTLASVRSAKVRLCRDVAANPEFSALREEAAQLGYASALVVPLLEEARGLSPRLPRKAFGAITIYSRLPQAFDEQEVGLLLQLAEDVSYCIRVLRLRQARARAEQRTQLLAETAARLLETESPQHVVEELCGKVLGFLNCQAFFNYLVDDSADPGSARLRLNACAGIPPAEAERIRWLDFGTAVCGCAARDAQRIVAEDIQHVDDPRTVLVKAYGIQAYACHPLMVGNRVLGTLSFGASNRTRFTAEELDLMKAVADLVAIAMERRRAQIVLQATARELQRSNVDLEQFAYVASHDLQEPLRAVGGYVKLLERRFGSVLDEKGLEYVAGAVEGAMRMERLINDLLSFSRVGTRGDKLTQVNLEAPLQQALHNLRSSLASIEGSVTQDALPTVTADATQLMQVFQNLIGNAIKFRGPEPPRIHVSAAQQNGCWVISVRDNGIGIEPQYYERIFQLFQRLHTRAHYPGTGIGLALCKRIIERHGGAIWVQSQPGQGSTFSFSLPDTTTQA